MRQLSFLDRLLASSDNALRTLSGGYHTTERDNPAMVVEPAQLTEQQKKHTAGLMRINHCGEVCAQALYQGQALTARLPEVRQQMERSAQEENDHLSWCEHRLKELDAHPSLLNPLWYFGSFTIGALAGAAGDKWSLGFVAETEHQVVKHLDEHLEQLANDDQKTQAILTQMREDELHHAHLATDAGGVPLPPPIKKIMSVTAGLMKSIVYRF
ncbi:2-polyprenyl-3-methyl-6-methoxy-1,4-benzoquinone monooxygenase [Pleionea litopenaei]|uniref:3-demethoxyubiquinol 3-hydroxylase n=1 Tax=Pleionea litopenaei TaxID=3070815 RepID=A0AA51X5A8_9GAMM|nr:2-polyprenyl-3-methyl-6-methoxy-1,4-benzoquinone monooxygenase [Pleionea sp. HL-JVS1]WMS85837.1 2-polyprenyl-3-methyl-6-methoxy-1,4-benzoquinone monooxygenase [Pleionea sp. HL-JVS1]